MKVFDEKVRPVIILSLLVLLALMGYSLGKLYEFLEISPYINYLKKKVFPEPKIKNELHYQREEDNPLR